MDKIGDTLSAWLLAQLDQLPLELLRGTSSRLPERIVDHILGEREAQEVRTLLTGRSDDTVREPTVLLPGIMGSLLASISGVGALLWLNPTVLLNGHVNILDLDETGQHDRSPDVEIVPVGIEKYSYIKLIVGLATHTRFYEFPYDWRRHLAATAERLHQRLEHWAQANPEQRFTLIGHSMGGMVARTYLALYPAAAERRLARVILLGSPLYGACKSMQVFTGQASSAQVVARLHAGNDIVSLAANLPSCYQLLPAPAELFPTGRPYPANWELYDARAWNLPCVRQDYLDDAYQLHKLLAADDPQVPIYQIAGCNRSTLTDIWRADDESPDGEPHWTLVSQESGEDAGDDTVPLWSASKPGHPTYYVEENHQLLPANTQAIAGILALVRGQEPELPRTLPEPSGLLQRINVTPLMQQVSELRHRLESGETSLEDLQKLFFAR